MMNTQNQMNYQIINDDTSVDVTSLHSFSLSNSCKCLFFSFRCLFSFFVIIFSIIFDLESSLLSVSTERTTQKIFRAENVIDVTNISFVPRSGGGAALAGATESSRHRELASPRSRTAPRSDEALAK